MTAGVRSAAARLHMQLWSFEDIGQPRKALTLLFACLDDWCLVGEYELVREVLRTVRLDKHTTSVALGFASITLTAREQIGKARVEYLARLAAWLRAKDPARAEELLRGLS